MAEITANLVKDLRERTGAGMMDCKKALTEVEGDMEAAIDWLRKKGLAAAAKKAGRVASEGLVAAAIDDASNATAGAVVEINAETDFVARNENFQNLVRNTALIAAKQDYTVDTLKAAPFPGEAPTVEDEITRLIAVIGENMHLRRVVRLSVSEGHVASYVHNAVSPGLGKIGVLVALESSGDKGTLADLGKRIAMHIAAANPQALLIENLDPTSLDREKTIVADQARASGRPDDIIAKMVEGRLRKFYEEVVLMEQTFIIDGKTKIRDMLETASKELNAPVHLKGYVRYALGEGVEKAESDFAAEVLAQAGL
ncbi:MAG: translation elongation factor Ts [Alphaproteobacteria bacterium]|jgi:elongation factor Ts|nr:translation elongation factor Ts [Alphaproteobacteria bacterium]